MVTSVWWVVETLCITQVISTSKDGGTHGKDKEEKERSGKEEEKESKRWEKKEMCQGGQEGMWKNKMRRRRHGKQKHESRKDRGWNEGS